MNVHFGFLIYFILGYFSLITSLKLENVIHRKKGFEKDTEFHILGWYFASVLIIMLWPLTLTFAIIDYRSEMAKIAKPKSDLQLLAEKVDKLQDTYRYAMNREASNQQHIFDLLNAVRDLQDTKRAEQVAQLLEKPKTTPFNKKGKK